MTDINYSPNLPSAGENVSFRATIKNISKGTSLEGIAIKVEFSIDGVSMILWSDNYTHSIAPGQSVTLTVNMGDSGVVWNAIEGTLTVKAVVNAGNTIFESNTQNNSYGERMVVTKPCDLIVTNRYLAPLIWLIESEQKEKIACRRSK